MMEFLIEYSLPILFVAIWVFTMIVNRDSQSLPQRNARPGARPVSGGPGPVREPRPGTVAAPPAQRGANPTYAPAAGRPYDASDEFVPAHELREVQPSRPATARRPPYEPVRSSEDIVFVETPPRVGESATPRSLERPEPRRKPSGARKRRGEDETQRALSEQVGRDMAQNRGAPLTSLASTLTSLNDQTLRGASSVAAVVTSRNAPPSLTADQLRAMIADGGRLREMALLTELLQPPISRRSPPRRPGA